MNVLTVVVEKTGTGYSGFLPDVPGIAVVADSFGELREQIVEAIALYVETSREYGEAVPEVLTENYEINFRFDIQAFMQWMSRTMSQRGLSEIADMNESLISQYASGIKKPGAKQLKRIEKAIHRFADDLQAISF